MQLKYGASLRSLRGKCSQKEFSKKYGLSQSAYARYEAQESEPPLAFLLAISNEYHVSIDYILTGRSALHLETYGDLLSMLETLANKLPIRFSSRSVDSDIPSELIEAMDITGVTDTTSLNQFSFADLLIYNTELGSMFETWQRMRNLVACGEIDQELYDMWLQKRIDTNATQIILKKEG